MNPLRRRELIKLLGITGGGLVMGLPLTACATGRTGDSPDALEMSPMLQVRADSSVHFYLPRVEMGQGTWHGLATLVAEELRLPPEQIQVHHAPVDPAFKNLSYGMQTTGGSNSMRTHYLPLRQLAADTRETLLQAASAATGVAVDRLRLHSGIVVGPERDWPMGEFAGAAAALEPVSGAPLTPDSAFQYIGKDRPRLDALAKATGTAAFGIDVDFDGLHRAVLVVCPVRGGNVKSYDDAAAKAQAGVKAVVALEHGVAVVAEHYWQAKQAAAKLQVEWNTPALAGFNSAGFEKELAAALDSEAGAEASKTGVGAAALEDAAITIQAEYFTPYLSHATMEPMNCTVRINEDSVDVWVGTQSPDVVRGAVARVCDVSVDSVFVHGQFLGGGFGRRSYPEHVEQAAAIARKSGLPVQLIWSREQDMKNGWYRPASLAKYRGGLDADGRIVALEARRAGPNVSPYIMQEAVQSLAPGFLPDGLVNWASGLTHPLFAHLTVDGSSVEGLADDYDVPNTEVRHISVDPGLPVGFWRSVGHSFSGFFAESFIDELAHAANQDPVAFRLRHLDNNPRLKRTLETAANAANWGAPVAGRGRGVAAHYSFQSYVAQVAEVSVVNGKLVVHRVVCALDCGQVVNPEMVVTQMQGGIIFGLTAALYGNTTVNNGVVQQSNFHDYPLLRLNEAPEIEVHIVPSEEAPTGVGEPGLPPIAAAVANALYDLNGTRLRSLPLAV